jgi:hypothetical protein
MKENGLEELPPSFRKGKNWFYLRGFLENQRAHVGQQMRESRQNFRGARPAAQTE